MSPAASPQQLTGTLGQDPGWDPLEVAIEGAHARLRFEMLQGTMMPDIVQYLIDFDQVKYQEGNAEFGQYELLP